MSFMQTDFDCHMRTYIVNGTMAADCNGAWIPTNGYRVAEFAAQWVGTSTPNGSFYIQGTDQNPNETTSPTTYNYYIDENKYSLTTATWAAGVISVNSASAGTLRVSVEPVSPWIRFNYTRTGGGAADTLQVQAVLKVG